MIKSVDELKSLILWAKEQKLKSLRLADISIEFSELSLLPEEPTYVPNTEDFTPRASSLREMEAALFNESI
jgi:hypothetical protein